MWINRFAQWGKKMSKKLDDVWAEEGHRWHFDFHMGLGYRICDDEEDYIALAKTMKSILKKDYKKYCYDDKDDVPYNRKKVEK